jgi:adenylate kinase family enzyme
MNRISIVGNSGSGKSTLARALGAHLGFPMLELDSLFHQANWTPLPTLDFQGGVREFIGTHPRWIVDGNYPAVLPDVWAAADTVIWMSPSRAENMRAIVRRTLRRAFTREVLWNGNREPLASVWRLDDPEASVVAWAWTRHAVYQRRYGAAMHDRANAHLRFVRLDSRGAASEWLAQL